jgi:hypothetical protein
MAPQPNFLSEGNARSDSLKTAAFEFTEDCGRYTKIVVSQRSTEGIERSSVFYDIRTSFDGTGILNLTVTATPICEKTQQPDPRSPFTFKLQIDNIDVQYKNAPVNVFTAFHVDVEKFDNRIETASNTMGGIYGFISHTGRRLDDVSATFFYRSIKSEVIKERTFDPAFYGLTEEQTYGFLLLGGGGVKRVECNNPSAKAFSHLLFADLTEAYRSRVIKVLPMRPMGNACDPMLNGKWQMSLDDEGKLWEEEREALPDNWKALGDNGTTLTLDTVDYRTIDVSRILR